MCNTTFSCYASSYYVMYYDFIPDTQIFRRRIWLLMWAINVEIFQDAQTRKAVWSHSVCDYAHFLFTFLPSPSSQETQDEKTSLCSSEWGHNSGRALSHGTVQPNHPQPAGPLYCNHPSLHVASSSLLHQSDLQLNSELVGAVPRWNLELEELKTNDSIRIGWNRIVLISLIVSTTYLLQY